MSSLDGARRRHVWIDRAGSDYRSPGLVLGWRHTNEGWEANVAVVGDSSVLVTWVPAADLHPVTDDRWQPPATGRLQ